jgi:neutral ceramidase
MAAQWLAGAAVRPFPIELGTPMAGYLARTGPATGTIDPLTISALALTAGERELVIVAADVVGVDSGLVETIAGRVPIERDDLLVPASHTHSGPAGIVARLNPANPDQLNPELRERFVEVVVATIQEARGRRQIVTVAMGRAPIAGLSANRNDPQGPFNPTLTAIAVRRPDDAPIAIAVHWACHPTILGAESRLVSAEFPGALRRELVRQLGEPDLPVLYLNGAAGDVSTRFTRTGQTLDEVERVGRGLAVGAIEALAATKRLEPSLNRAATMVELPRPSKREIAAMLDGARQALEENGVSDAASRRIAETRAQGAQLLTEMTRSGVLSTAAAIRLEGWKIGDLPLIAVPGELFASLGERIANVTEPPAVVVGYANGYVGYLADRAAYASGTYEALASPYAAGAGELVMEAGVKLVQ